MNATERVVADLLELRVEGKDSYDRLAFDEKMRVDESNSLHCLARLHLLATGDRRSGFLFLNPTTYDENGVMRVNLLLPSLLRQRLLTTEVKYEPIKFSASAREAVTAPEGYSGNWSTVRVSLAFRAKTLGETIDLADDRTMRAIDLFFNSDDNREKAEASHIIDEWAASQILVYLLNISSMNPFNYDNGSRRVVISPNFGLGIEGTLGVMITEGKVCACPHCGRPVYMPRKTSNPFCRKSHQTRYSEAAKAMKDRGAKPEEIAKRYPHINPETILGWFPVGERA